MRVVRLHARGDLRFTEEPVPAPAPGERLVRVTAVGICGSDLHWFDEGGIGDSGIGRPLVLGHELAGVTEDGARVAVEPGLSCGACRLCAEGHPNLCEAIQFAGHDVDGGLREWMAWPVRALHALPASLSDADGAMLEPLGVALHAVDLAHLARGAVVGVFGCGPIGLLVVQVARLAGASRVFATELASRPARLDAARRFGADTVVADGSEAGVIRRSSGGGGLDVAVEAAGDNAAVDAAIEAVRPGARVVLAGIPPESRTSFVAATARRKGLTIALARRMKRTYPRAINLVEEGKVDVASLVTDRFPLEESEAAFRAASRREGLKVVVATSSASPSPSRPVSPASR
jgi:L-iditol 2-dehydrogenase